MADYKMVGWFPTEEFSGDGTTFGDVVAYAESLEDGKGIGGRPMRSGDIVLLCRVFGKEEAAEMCCHAGCTYSTPYMILDRRADSSIARTAGIANIFDLDHGRLLVKLRHGFASFKNT